MHRPQTDWQRMEKRHDTTTLEGRIYQGLRRLILLRKSLAGLAGQQTRFIYTGNPHVFGYLREHEQRVLVLANFSEYRQVVDERLLPIYGMSLGVVDLISENEPTTTLEPYQFQWIAKKI